MCFERTLIFSIVDEGEILLIFFIDYKIKMKVFKITSAIVVALLMTTDVAAIKLSSSPINNQAVQIKSQSRNQLVIEANN